MIVTPARTWPTSGVWPAALALVVFVIAWKLLVVVTG